MSKRWDTFEVTLTGPRTGVCVFPKDDTYSRNEPVYQPDRWGSDLTKGHTFGVEIIDPWEMTITPVEGVFEERFQMKLPSQPYLAIRLQKLYK
ncbi:MAG: DUF5605 domain-containing protein [Planctomycetota bacterium]|jgi:hypothetical protein